MNYFEAKGHERFLRRFRDMAEVYWEGGDRAPSQSAIRECFREAEYHVKALGYDPVWISGIPTRAEDTHGNFLGDVLSPRPERRDGARAFLDEVIGAAALARRRTRNRLLSPWCWPVDFVGMVIAFPLRAMRVAGLPRSAEGEWWVRSIQATFTLAVAGALATFGWQAVER